MTERTKDTIKGWVAFLIVLPLLVFLFSACADRVLSPEQARAVPGSDDYCDILKTEIITAQGRGEQRLRQALFAEHCLFHHGESDGNELRFPGVDPLEAIAQERDDSVTALAERWGFDRPIAADVHDAALAWGRSVELVASMVAVESAGDSTAVSWAGAVGLIQVMPSTARALGRDAARLTEARYNLDTGLQYLAEMQERFDGSLAFALKAYNAGPTWAEWHVARGYEARDMWYPSKVLALT